MKRGRGVVWRKLMSEILAHFLLKRARLYRESAPQMAVFAHDFIGMEINVYGRYEDRELEVLADFIANMDRSKLVLDVGANIGNHTLFFVQQGFKRICAFEPNPRTVNLLKFNTEHYSQVVVFPFGLSNDDMVLDAVIPPTNAGGASLAQYAINSGTERVSFALRKFDALDLASETIGLLKLDVEGHEAEVIEGMASALERDTPVIIFECNRGTMPSAADRMIARLKTIGYDEFLAIEPPASRIPAGTPHALGRILRLLERLFFPRFASCELKPIVEFEARNYPMVVASRSVF